jgi:V/A-type H+-transporting ATPase subunit E
MSLENIKEKIISDAQKDADKIMASTDKQILEMRSLAKSELEEIKSEILKDAKEKAQAIRNEKIIKQKIQNSNDLLIAKRNIINKILSQVLIEIEKLDEEKYLQLISKQADKISSISLSQANVFCPQDKKELIKKVLEKKYPKVNFTFNNSKNIQGGFKIQTKNSSINLTFENLIEENKTTLESKINQIAFNKIING